MPLIQAIMRSMAVSAAKGDFRSQKLIAEYVSRTEEKERDRLTEELQGAMEIKARLEQELERREKNNLPSHDLLPHPDDMIIDMSAGTVKFWGPVTKEDMHDLKMLLDEHRGQTEIVEDLFQTLRATTENGERAEIIKTLRAPLLNQAKLQTEIELRASPQCVRRILEEGA